MIAWAKDALAFLHKNHVKFRDLDPSNLGKTMDGRTVITNIAESRSGPKGRRDLGVLESAAKGLAVAWRTDPHGAVRGIMGYLAKSNTVRADAYQDTTPKYPGKPEPKPEPVAQAEAPAAPKAPAPNPSALAVAQAVKTIRKLARHMERDADSVSEESRHFDEQDAAALVDLVEALEKAYKKAAKELVQLR
jgi:hypothetical protein